MIRDEFWSLIETARRSRREGKELRDEIERLLWELPDEDLVDYAKVYSELIDEADQWRLWDAICLINGGCSDDGFSDFRDFLISKGRSHFERVLNDPETLLDDELDARYGEWPYQEVHFRRAANKVYGKRNQKLNDSELALSYSVVRSGTKGHPIDIEDKQQVQTAFPRIWQHIQTRRSKCDETCG